MCRRQWSTWLQNLKKERNCEGHKPVERNLWFDINGKWGWSKKLISSIIFYFVTVFFCFLKYSHCFYSFNVCILCISFRNCCAIYWKKKSSNNLITEILLYWNLISKLIVSVQESSKIFNFYYRFTSFMNTSERIIKTEFIDKSINGKSLA